MRLATSEWGEWHSEAQKYKKGDLIRIKEQYVYDICRINLKSSSVEKFGEYLYIVYEVVLHDTKLFSYLRIKAAHDESIKFITPANFIELDKQSNRENILNKLL